jgi:hypothetical protein
LVLNVNLLVDSARQSPRCLRRFNCQLCTSPPNAMTSA